MKSIHGFHFKISHLRNGEHFQLHWSVNSLLLPLITGIGALANLWRTYRRDFEKENAVYKRNMALEETKEIYRKDRMRGYDFRFLRRAVAYAKRLPEAGQKEAAEQLYDLLENYKGADKTPLGENTALFTSLLHDLKKPEYRAAVDSLGLTSLVATLDGNNRAVEYLYDKRSETLNILREEGNMESERLRVDHSYATLVNAINAIYAANEYGEQDADLRGRLEEIIDGVNARIEQTRLVFSRRTAHRRQGEDRETDDMPENAQFFASDDASL